jgi:hypothetical protein
VNLLEPTPSFCYICASVRELLVCSSNSLLRNIHDYYEVASVRLTGECNDAERRRAVGIAISCIAVGSKSGWLHGNVSSGRETIHEEETFLSLTHLDALSEPPIGCDNADRDVSTSYLMLLQYHEIE